MSMEMLVSSPEYAREPAALSRRIDITDTFFFRSCCAIGILAYADSANILSVSTFGFDGAVKYAYFIFVILLYVNVFLTTRRIAMGFDGPTILLAFTALSVTALGFQLLSPVQNNSYAGAFLATLILSTAAIFDVERYTIDPLRAARRIQSLLLILSGLYVLELTIRAVSGLAYFEDVINQTNHIKSFVLVASTCLAILSRDRKSLLLTTILFIVSQVLRPSSSLIVALFLCCPIAFAMTRYWMSTAKTVTYVAIAFAAVTPIALYLSPDLKTFITDAETWTKEDLLQGRSNTFFRLAIQDLAIDRLQDTSIAFGVMFSSGNSVQLGRKFAWWLQYYPSGLAAIHSDYVSIIYQSGAVGYALYNTALLQICRFLFRGIVVAHGLGKPYTLMGLSVCCTVILVFYSSSNPFLQYYTISHIAWFIIAMGYLQVRSMRRRDDVRMVVTPR